MSIPGSFIGYIFLKTADYAQWISYELPISFLPGVRDFYFIKWEGGTKEGGGGVRIKNYLF